MADNKIRINIQLGEVKHPLNIERQDEPTYRAAARLVNERLQVYQERFRGSEFPQEFLMSFAALDIAVRYTRLHQSSDVEAAEADLSALVAEMQQYLG